MQKVISINLNGNAYQIEEDGYDALISYLETAQRQLRDNPDRAEILADLEQAIAEKCQRFLTAHKTVVSIAEVGQIIKEMGPVDGATESGSGATAGTGGAAGGPGAATGAPRRLYRIADGAMIAGVCNGLGAYLHVDPTILRLIFVGLLFLSGGGFVIVYLVLAFVLPEANTSEERAAAYGQPFNAQELIDRAKKQYAGYKNGRAWRRDWRREQREWRRQWRTTSRTWAGGWGVPPYAPAPAAYTTRVFVGVMMPVLTLMSIGLFWLWLFAIVTLVTRQEVFGQPLPEDVPLWLGFVILIVIYQVVAWPIHMARRSSYWALGGAYHGTIAALDGLLSVVFLMLGIWLAFHYVPEVREFLQHLPDVIRSFRDSFGS
jgi:phage shock protein PspC (stress-responsive transcriptional regulator)